MPHGEYGDVHRTIVQTFMSKKVMPEKEALELVRSSARKYPDCQVAEPRNPNELTAFFLTVDKEIGEGGVGFAKLKRLGVKEPKDIQGDARAEPSVFWGLQSVKDSVKSTATDLAKLMENSQYTDSELYLFKLIIEELCTVGGKGRNGMLDHNFAINLCNSVKPRALKVDEAMSCIERLVDEGWLIFHDAENARNARSKRLTLGLRAMIDLQHFITTTWPEELCCVWDNDWLFKWIAVDSLAAQDGVEGASERRDDAGEEESEEMEGASPGKRQRRSAGGTAAGGEVSVKEEGMRSRRRS